MEETIKEQIEKLFGSPTPDTIFRTPVQVECSRGHSMKVWRDNEGGCVRIQIYGIKTELKLDSEDAAKLAQWILETQ